MIESACIYIFDGSSYLMMHRDKKKNDVNQGKWIGIGGKKEACETIRQCAVRETAEEIQKKFSSDAFQFLGILNFFYENKEPEKITVYRLCCDPFPAGECAEGTLQWIPQEKVLSLELWEGDRLFLKEMLADSKVRFTYDLHYDAKDRLTAYTKKEQAYE